MKEIKFRAWCEEKQKMYLDIWSIDFNKQEIYVKSVGYLPFSMIELEQYIGSEDINGREIYEGDIIQVEGHPFQADVTIGGNHEIIWDNRDSMYCTKGWGLSELLPWATVVGNIHELEKP